MSAPPPPPAPPPPRATRARARRMPFRSTSSAFLCLEAAEAWRSAAGLASWPPSPTACWAKRRNGPGCVAAYNTAAGAWASPRAWLLEGLLAARQWPGLGVGTSEHARAPPGQSPPQVGMLGASNTFSISSIAALLGGTTAAASPCVRATGKRACMEACTGRVQVCMAHACALACTTVTPQLRPPSHAGSVGVGKAPWATSALSAPDAAPTKVRRRRRRPATAAAAPTMASLATRRTPLPATDAWNQCPAPPFMLAQCRLPPARSTSYESVVGGSRCGARRASGRARRQRPKLCAVQCTTETGAK
eukprot:364786-Chlamydomonas_euryale.AAC.9